MAANPIKDQFIEALRVAMANNAIAGEPEEAAKEFAASKQRADELAAKSDNSIHYKFVPGIKANTGLSEGYTNDLLDIVDFYKNEFGIVPKVDISMNPNRTKELGPGVTGFTNVDQNGLGRHEAVFRYLTKAYEDSADEISRHSAESGLHPKNSNRAQTPVHELGHDLAFTLFNDTMKPGGTKEVYKKALKDIGVDENDYDSVYDAVNNISQYAGLGMSVGMDPKTKKRTFTGPNEQEVLAEAITDYYFNRNKAADLSKAIVSQLKNKNNRRIYNIRQTGGIGEPSDSFVQNLKRYNAIQ